MTRDRYPDLGPKEDLSSFDSALERVREAWPEAWQEGSTGLERTWWVREGATTRCIAHHWETRKGRVYVRVAPKS